MKEVIIRDLNNKIISDKNLYEDPTEFLELNKKHNTWGRNERWVRAKEESGSIENGNYFCFYPEEQYLDEDVLDTKIEINDLQEEDPYILLRADYTIEVEDYNPVPTSVSPMQIRLALNELGMRSLVENTVTNSNQDVKDMWLFASSFDRNYPILLQLVQEINNTLDEFSQITTEQIDNLFRVAGTK